MFKNRKIACMRSLQTSNTFSNDNDFSFDASTTAIPQINGGKLKALAVSSLQRLSGLPDTPTVAEGIPGFMGDSWTGLLARKGTPDDVVLKLSSETIKILANPAFQKRLQDVGLRTGNGSPSEFAKFITNESAIWSKVVRDNNITAE
jgi:tripartite-type tricarboxylate transporter receptor subunit TctC